MWVGNQQCVSVNLTSVPYTFAAFWRKACHCGNELMCLMRASQVHGPQCNDEQRRHWCVIPSCLGAICCTDEYACHTAIFSIWNWGEFLPCYGPLSP